MEEKAASKKEGTPPQLVEDVDFYLDKRLMVLTSLFLLKRGYCCENGCRHCPYQKDSRGL